MALPRLCFLGRAQGRLAAPMRTQYRRSTVCATTAVSAASGANESGSQLSNFPKARKGAKRCQE